MIHLMNFITFSTKLYKHAPKKKKLMRRNSKFYSNRNLCRAITKRFRLKNIANKTEHSNDIKNYKRQRISAVNLNKNAKFEYFKRYYSKRIIN